ncbi:MAG: glycoside hydrolase family 127 protein [Clostridia bacterium]|nr:glycoside hydrolase family 127 protein [Clostridia bacterium]
MSLSALAAIMISFIGMTHSVYAKNGGTESAEDSLELHYTFDDPDNPGKDVSGKGNDGKLVGKTKITDGEYGKCVQFLSYGGNSDAYIELPVKAVNKGRITFAAWAKYDHVEVGNNVRLFSVETGDHKSFILKTHVDSSLSGYQSLVFKNSSSYTVLKTEGMIPQAVYQDWHHIAVSYDGEEMRLFINGALINTVKAHSPIGSWKIVRAFLGKTGEVGNIGTYSGLLDDVKIYSDVLSETEIKLAAGITDERSERVIKLLSDLRIGGQTPTEFSVFSDTYYSVLPEGTENPPEVTADPPCEGAALEIRQADCIPGKATVSVAFPSGAERTVEINFVRAGAELLHPVIEDVRIDDPFWNDRLKLFSEVTVPYILESWVTKTFDNLRNFDKVAAGHRNTKDYVGTMTWGEGDFYASMAGACRFLRSYPNEKLKNQILGYVDHIFAASESVKNGYFSIYHLLQTDGKMFTETANAGAHGAIFNLGYLLELGMALYEATGDARMLRAGVRFLNCTVEYSDHGRRNFVAYHQAGEYFIVEFCGWFEKHPEIRNDKYLSDVPMDLDDYYELAGNLLSYRGYHVNRVGGQVYNGYNNDHQPFTKTFEATGHAAGCQHLYTAISEYGRLTGDLSYVSAGYRLWENLVSRQTYITGSAGSIASYEGLSGDYGLPNESYSETCTSGALILYSDSLASMFADSRYGDIIENALYNTMLGDIGQDGTGFFYENPLSTNISSRYVWHPVACCTKYVCLIFGELPRYIYSCDKNNIYVNQYIGSTATIRLSSGNVVLNQTANWAETGNSAITVSSGAGNIGKLYLRIPEWSDNTSVKVNGKAASYEIINGFAVITGLKDGDSVEIKSEISPKREYADENVKEDIGRVAVRRGPVIYCMEGIDNPSVPLGHSEWVILPKGSALKEEIINDLWGGTISLTSDAKIMYSDGTKENVLLTLIPFYARTNRGASSVLVWLTEDPASEDDLPVNFGNSVELRQLGASYKALTNASNPQGGGSKNVSVIIDGVTRYESDTQQYDSYRATLTDSLGRNEKTEWIGVSFESDYAVTHVVFWEGGHWNDGGWFGSAPYVQVKIGGKWTDVGFVVSPEYPGDSLTEQQPTNESYVFTLSEPTVCGGVRILGKQNSLAGHFSCTEIEVYGMTREMPDETSGTYATDESTTNKTPETNNSGLSGPAKAAIIAAGGAASCAATYLIVRKAKKKKEND